MKVLMIAPPGAGKGTQGAIIASHFGVPHIATGALLRDHVARNTALGRTVAEHLNRGDLVPDDLVLGMVRAAFVQARVDGATGYVLDGLPRTMEQAQAAYRIGKEMNMAADVALHLDITDPFVTKRLLARALLDGRTDDTAEVISRRLAVYHQVTDPILSWYSERGILLSVDSCRPIPQVATDVLVALRLIESRASMTAS